MMEIHVHLNIWVKDSNICHSMAYMVRDGAASSALEPTTLVEEPQSITYTDDTMVTNPYILVDGDK